MTISPGSRLGHYEILDLLGAGGMGEVYRGRDTRLNRDVAVKVIPAALAADADYLVRFQREAQVLAALNHPHIAAIYGLEENAIVMEIVEGPTIADRLAAGPLPLREALVIAQQIAAALEAAHEKGIVHRDLKPANVKLTVGGSVKVLDFGLAKTAENNRTGDVSNSPTLTLRATQVGVIMGTAGYMAPEQAAGKPVDKRADIWSFGVVLWEMLAGRRLFEGETVAHTLAAVLTRDPDWQRLPASTPPAIRELARRCLDRDPQTRLRDIGEARILLERPPGSAAGAAPPPMSKPVPWICAAALAFAAALAIAALHFRETPPENPLVRTEISAPEKIAFQIGGGTNLSVAGPAAISPDGKLLVFSAESEGVSQLWIRPLSAPTARPMAGTKGAIHPFWSPDSRYVGFFADGKLKKIDTQGGPPVTLCDSISGRGGTWNRDGVIVFQPSGGLAPLHRVSSSGGIPVPFATELAAKSPRWPWFLPDGRHLLVSAAADVYLVSLDTGKWSKLIQARSNAVYAQGYLLYMREDTVMAQHFDTDKHVLRGEAHPLADSVRSVGNQRRGVFTVSENGVLVFQSGSGSTTFSIDWFDRAGKFLGKAGEAEASGPAEFHLSPDEKTLAINVYGAIWLIDVSTGARSRFLNGRVQSIVWAADGRSIFYRSLHDGQEAVYRKPLGVGGEESITPAGSRSRNPSAVSPDGRFLVTNGPAGIETIALTCDRTPQQLSDAAATYASVRFSPDGKWFVFSLAEEVFVRIFTSNGKSPGAPRQISTSGGREPRWRGKEIFYHRRDGGFSAVEIAFRGDEIQPGVERPVFGSVTNAVGFDITGDGKRIVMGVPTGKTEREVLNVVQNWPAVLK